jgi:hypothetical protein
MSTQTPIPGQQPAEDNEKGITVETVGEAAPAQTVPQQQPPEDQPGEAGAPSEQQPQEGSDASGVQPDEAAEAAATQKKEKSDVQKRIDTLTRRRYELEGRNEELEYELARLKRRVAAAEGDEQPEKPAAAAAVDSEKPVRDNFTTYEDWVEAISLFNAKVALREEREDYNRQQQAVQQNTVVENWNKSLESARTKYEDFDTVVGSDLKIPQVAFNAIVDSPVGPDVAYFLGQHPDIAASLGKLSPVACVRAIGRIETQFGEKSPAAAQPADAPGASQPKQASGQAARPAAVQRPKPITSAASAPVEPVGSRSARSTKNPDEMSYQEYKKWREEGNGR